MTTLCVCLHPFFVLKHLHTPHSAHMHIHIHALEPILRIHWIMENTGNDKRPFTFHPYLGITQWFVATGEGGTAGRTSFIFFWDWKSHSVEICYELAWETRAPPPSLSLCGWQMDWVCICVSLVSFGDFGYFLFFVHSCIHGHLSSECLWYIPDGGCGRWGMGRLSAPCKLVFLFGW
jgi:hypothetical protein